MTFTFYNLIRPYNRIYLYRAETITDCIMDGKKLGPTNGLVTPLLTDMYQLSMAYAYWKNGKANDPAVFELFFRKSPFGGEYTVFAGLGEVLEFLAEFRYDFFIPLDCSNIDSLFILTVDFYQMTSLT